MNKYYRKPAIKWALLRVFLFLLCLLVLIIGFEGFGLLFFEEAFPNIDQRSPMFFTLSRGIETILAVILIWVFRTQIDHRPFLTDWFSMRNRSMDLPLGFLVGALLIGLSAFILKQMGLINYLPGELSLITGAQYVLLFFVGALFEELVFRGYIQDNLQQDFHPAIAIIITSVLFMMLHIGNPNLETTPLINLFLAGILLGASFIYTRNLWFPLGLHWAWNLFQGPIFGFEVSGLHFESLFHQEIKEQNIWTGGDFGLEGSILATIIICATTLLILLYYNQITRHENS